jgi:hypothetical protein
MSGSRRKLPIFGHTTSSTEKWFKRQERKALRRRQKVCDQEGRQEPHPKEYGDPWCGPKDGKSWWGKATARDMGK